MATWYAKASKAQDFSRKYLGSPIKPKTVVLHSTESTGWPGYNAGATAPHLTVMPNFKTKTVSVRQHFPINRSARALENRSGGVETNTLDAVQIELIGTCDPTTHRKWKTQHIFMPEAPEWFLEGVADVLKWINKSYPSVPLRDAAVRGWTAYPKSYGDAKQRLSGSEWTKAKGVLGHQHIPENAHGDPGSFPIKTLIALTKPSKPGKAKRFGRHILVSIWGNDGGTGTKTAVERIPQIVSDVVAAKPLIVDCQEVRSGSQLKVLTDEFARRGFVRSAYYKEAKLATFTKRGEVDTVGPIVREQFFNQNQGQKEGVLARSYRANGLTVTFGQQQLDRGQDYSKGRVLQAKEGIKSVEVLAKRTEAKASVISGNQNSKSLVTSKAMKPAGYHEAWGDKGKDHVKKIDHTYLKGAKAAAAFERSTKSNRKMQITDINVII